MGRHDTAGMLRRHGRQLRGGTGRLRSDRLIQKFVMKFVNDSSYQLLLDSMASGDYEEAFRAAHTIKGVCQNLGFTPLLDSSSQLSEALRHGYTPEADSLVEQVSKNYQETVGAIRAFEASAGV